MAAQDKSMFSQDPVKAIIEIIKKDKASQWMINYIGGSIVGTAADFSAGNGFILYSNSGTVVVMPYTAIRKVSNIPPASQE